MEPIKITLTEAITAHGEPVTEIVLKEPRAKHLRGLSAENFATFGGLLDIVAGVTGIPASSLNQLNLRDVLTVTEAMSSFFTLEQPMSKTPPS